MSTAIYWDTSALLKLYAPERDSEHFRSLDGIHLGAVLATGIQKITTTDIRLRDAASCLGIDWV